MAEMEGLRKELQAKTHELELKQAELDALQDDIAMMTETNREIEKELEDSLAQSEERVQTLEKDVMRAKAALEDAKSQSATLNAELAKMSKEVGELRAKVKGLEEQKRVLETDNDTLEQKARALESADEALRYQVDMLTEEKVFLQHELEDARLSLQETETRLQQEITDLRNDLHVTRLQHASAPTPAQSEGGGSGGAAAQVEQLLPPCVPRPASPTAGEEEEKAHTTQEGEGDGHGASASIIAGLEHELAETKKRNQELEADVTALRRRMGEAEARVMTAEAEAEMAQIERDEALDAQRTIERQAKEWEARGRELEGDLKGFEDQINEDTNLIADQHAQITTLTEQVEALSQQVQLQQQAAVTQPSPSLTAPLSPGLSLVLPTSPRLEPPSENETQLAARVAELEALLLEVRRKSLLAAKPVYNTRASLNLEDRDPLSAEDAAVDKAVRAGDVMTLAHEARACLTKYRQQRAINARMLSRMGSLQNRIQVCCRIRPLNEDEATGEGRVVVESLSDCEVGFRDRRGGHQGWKSFAFDRVWGPHESQEEVFSDVEPLALAVVDGQHACIMAYGQTGSGKTYTMEGSRQDNAHGISYRTLHKVLQLIALRQEAKASEGDGTMSPSAPRLHFTVTVGMVEVYNDDVRDLLASPIVDRNNERVPPSLEIRRDGDGQLQLPGMVVEAVETLEDVTRVMSRGHQNRATASTNVHEHSSRSHSIILVSVTSAVVTSNSSAPVGGSKSGCLYLVDLAGSERVKKSAVTGAELKEAQHINKSLSALGDVMEALDHKASYTPYRNSKLTYLLQDCLGGSSRTLMIVTACPLDDNADETLCTLTFAARVRSITLSPAHSAVKAKNMEQELKAVKAEVRTLAAKKAQVEESLALAKKELGQAQRRVGSAMEAKSRTEAEGRRALEDMVAVLKVQKEEVAGKLSAEKAAGSKVAAELAETQKQLRKLQSQMDVRSTSHTDLLSSLTARDSEIQELRKQIRALKAQVSQANGGSLAATLSSSLHNTTALGGTRSERAISGAAGRSQHKQHGSHGSDTPSIASLGSSTTSTVHTQGQEVTAAGEPDIHRSFPPPGSRKKPPPSLFNAVDRARFGLPEPPSTHRLPPRTPDDTGSSSGGPSRVALSGGVGVRASASAGPGKGSSIPVPRPRMALRARPPPEKETNVGKDGKPLWR